MLARSLVSLLLVGCATAAEVQPDGPPNKTGNPDAPAGTGGHDASTDSTNPLPDAPVQQGTCATPASGILATWTFTGATGSQAMTAATSSVTGLTAGQVSRAASLTVASGQNSINSTNWGTTATRDATRYYTVTLTPPSGCKLDLTSAAIDAKASGTGPAAAAVSTGADTFAGTVSLSTSVASTPSLAITDVTTALEIRIYGYNASSTTGTMRLQNTLTFTGSLH